MSTANFWEPFAQDIRYSFRSMASSKLFTGMAVLSLALGIGANTAIYSFMDSVMLRALPVKQPERLVILNWRAKSDAPVVHSHWGSNYDEPGGGTTSPNFPYAAFELLRDHNDVLSTLFGHVNGGRLNLVIDGNAELADGQYVTGGFFSGLGVPPAAGRLIDRDDDKLGATPIAVITNDYWHTKFGASPTVVGKQIQINGTSFTIAGVSAPEFYGVSPDDKPSVFLPMANIGLTRDIGDQAMFREGTYYWIELMGRLKSGVTLTEAQTQLAGPFHLFVENTATKDRERADLPSLWLQEGGSGVDSLRRQYSKPLWILMAMVGLILAVACFNIANLLLARAASRRREIALRLSLGAGRFRIMRQLLTESVVLALLSGLAGIGVAALCIRFLLLMLTNGRDNFTVTGGSRLACAFIHGADRCRQRRVLWTRPSSPGHPRRHHTRAQRDPRQRVAWKGASLRAALRFEPGPGGRADRHFSPAGCRGRSVRSHGDESSFSESGFQRRERSDFQSRRDPSRIQGPGA